MGSLGGGCGAGMGADAYRMSSRPMFAAPVVSMFQRW